MTPAPVFRGFGDLRPKGRKVFITDDRSGSPRAVMAEFATWGVNASWSRPNLKFKKEPAGLRRAAHHPEPASKPWMRISKMPLKLTRHVAADLLESAKAASRFFFATVTRMDGASDSAVSRLQNPISGALARTGKTAAAEWPEVICPTPGYRPSGRTGARPPGS